MPAPKAISTNLTSDVGRFEAGFWRTCAASTRCSDMITKDDPKIKGDAEEKIKAALDDFAADFA